MKILQSTGLKNTLSRWSNRSVDHKIFTVTALLAVLGLAIKILGSVKEAAIAAYFGVSDVIDAFAIALILVTFFMNVIGASLNKVLIPLLVQAHSQQGKVGEQRVLSAGLSFCLITFVVVTLLLLTAENLIWPVLISGFDAEKVALTRILTMLVWPSLIFYNISQVFAAVLNSRRRFALAGITPACISITILLSLLVLESSFGIFALAIGTTLGTMVETIVLAIAIIRRGLSLYPGSMDLAQTISSRLTPIALGAIFLSGTGIIDRAIAATLEPGSIAMMNYGNKVISLVLVLGTTAVGTASMPYISAIVNNRNWHGLRTTMHRYVILSFIIGIPLTMTIFFNSQAIVELVFERGAFTSKDSLIVSSIQAIYAFQIPTYLAVVLNIRISLVLQTNYRFVMIAATNMILNTILNIILIKYIGVQGIALATDIVYFIVFIIIFLSNEQVITKSIRSEREIT